MKKVLIILGVIIAAIIAWYLISPAFIDIEADEASPLDLTTQEVSLIKVADEDEGGLMRGRESMSDEQKVKFDRQMEMVKDEGAVMNDVMVDVPALVAQGLFKPFEHEVAGKALLIDTPEGTILRFEDFETINGPNLHIYLSSDINSEDYIDLGPIKATKGNVNYTIDESIDTERYNKVLVWCVPFRVLFSYAELVKQ